MKLALERIHSKSSLSIEELKENTEENSVLQLNFSIFRNILRQLVYWIRTSDTLISSSIEGNPRLLDKVGEFLLNFIKCNNTTDPTLENICKLIWVVLVNGFELFFRTSESQFDFMKTLLTYSFENK